MRYTAIEAEEILLQIAKGMNVKVISWNDVNEAIEKDISFSIIVSTDKYISEPEFGKLKQKALLGVFCK